MTEKPETPEPTDTPPDHDGAHEKDTRLVADHPTPDRRWLLAYDWDLVRQGTLLIPSEGG